jgi:hypothetical protein
MATGVTDFIIRKCILGTRQAKVNDAKAAQLESDEERA